MPPSEIPGRVHRAFRAHGSFGPAADDAWVLETTPFDARVRVGPVHGDGSRDDDTATGEESPDAAAADPAESGDSIRFTVRVDVPALSSVTADDVADVVEDGWTETFERRVVDVGGVTRGAHEFDPAVHVDDDTISITFELTDTNERRGVDDAAALINFVEGTYVQGVIPGYEYTAPVTDLLSTARQRGEGGSF